jgi:hypothetical protein
VHLTRLFSFFKNIAKPQSQPHLTYAIIFLRTPHELKDLTHTIKEHMPVYLDTESQEPEKTTTRQSEQSLSLNKNYFKGIILR